MIPNPQALGLPCWTPGHPFGVPRVPPGFKWVPKWSQNASQNGCHRHSANQNADCQQTTLFTVFFGGARNLQKLVFAVPIPAPVAQPTFWPPAGNPQKAFGVPSSSHKYKKMSKVEPTRAPMLGPCLVILPLFAVPGALGSQNGSQGSPQEPPGPLQASIFCNFGSIFD